MDFIIDSEHLSMARFQRDIFDSIDEEILRKGGKSGNKII